MEGTRIEKGFCGNVWGKLTKANAQSRKALFAVHLPDFYTSKKFVVVIVQTKKEPYAQHTLNTATVHVVCYFSDSQCCVNQEKGSQVWVHLVTFLHVIPLTRPPSCLWREKQKSSFCRMKLCVVWWIPREHELLVPWVACQSSVYRYNTCSVLLLDVMSAYSRVE